MNCKRKIAIFTGYYLPHLGGVERYTERLAKQLVLLGNEIVIVTSNHDEENLPWVSEEEGIKIYRLPIRNITKRRYPILKKNKVYKNVIQLFCEEHCDFYLCQTRFHLTTLEGLKLARLNGKRAMIFEHGSDHFTVNNSILDYFGEKYEHFLTNKIKKYNVPVYGVSQRCNDWLQHFGIQAAGVFYNAVDDDAYEKYNNSIYSSEYEGKIIISFAGRLIREKGIRELVSAFTILSEEYSDIVLLIAGTGELFDELKVNNKNRDSIKLLGKLNYDEVMGLYNQSDIFVYPSMFPEGLPTSILEAGIMKTAVVATDRGGTVEVILNHDYGIIVEENTRSIYEGIKQFLSDVDYRERAKEKLQHRVACNFTWKNVAINVDKEVDKLITK